LPARQQLEIDISLQNIEVGHTPASIRESLLDKVISAGDKFVNAVKKEYPPGIIGPFSLQSVITRDLEIIVYDVSLRVPGNPILATTSPYTKYKYGTTFGVGRRIAMELKKAQQEGRLEEIVT
jgi:5-formaminoimidazole-4-carboxamide-1-(beta)-D-ribofuranosyl 5'-monophosphate synthetase